MKQEKHLYIIDGYRIWAYSLAEAHLEIIKKV